MENKDENKKQKIKTILIVLFLLVGAGAIFGWYKFFREEPQPDWVMSTPEMRFKYGSIGAEHTAGIPYWIWYVLPRIFPDLLPGPGGYASLGMVWEQGQEMPIGFTKKVIGFPRVANTCAVCHTSSYRSKEGENPTFVVAGPGNTTNIEGFFHFLVDVAKDPRFNADTILTEMRAVTDVSFIDGLLYRFLIIPFTQRALLERQTQFEWIYRADFPEWGRGRDDAMNLTKYFMIKLPMDDTFGPTDMPSIWNLKKYDPEAMTMNWDGASHDAYSVITDSALGLLNDPPKDREDFLGHMKWLEDYLRNKPAPGYPFPIDQEKVALGKPIFENSCAACHASERTGKPVSLAEVGTDENRLLSWSKEAAIAANRFVIENTGIQRKGLVEEKLIGYTAMHLDGIWLRAPYLHNGSVPTLHDLFESADQRPKVFYRGYNVYDPVKVGFITQGEEAMRVGTKHDVAEKGNGNGGHEYGKELMPEEKAALIEYLKTL